MWKFRPADGVPKAYSSIFSALGKGADLVTAVPAKYLTKAHNWCFLLCLEQALVHVGRANRSGQLERSAYQDEIPKTADKMMALLAIVTSLAPGAKIDEQVRRGRGSRVHDRSNYQCRDAHNSRGHDAPYLTRGTPDVEIVSRTSDWRVPMFFLKEWICFISWSLLSKACFSLHVAVEFANTAFYKLRSQMLHSLCSVCCPPPFKNAFDSEEDTPVAHS